MASLHRLQVKHSLLDALRVLTPSQASATLPRAIRSFHTASTLRKPALTPDSKLSQPADYRTLIREYSQPAAPGAAPPAFYQGTLGKIRSVSDITHENEAGLPSTGREDATIGVNAAKK